MNPLSLIFGALVGFSLGLTGGGGAIFAVPLLVYGLGVPPREAVGISLGLLQLRDNGFRPISIVALGAESPRQIRALAFDRAFPAPGRMDFGQYSSIRPLTTVSTTTAWPAMRQRGSRPIWLSLSESTLTRSA